MNSLFWVEYADGDTDTAVVATPAGKFALTAISGVLIKCDWAADDAPVQSPDGEFLRDLLAQLQRYWENPSAAQFSAPLLLQGSAFSRTVWEELCNIPCGETRSYGALAKRLQTAPRAVGAACRSNPFTLLIPCHRVVAVSGLGGYAGQRAGRLFDIKQRLLAHEGYKP
jgi:methylated-DNA-[protein]-cysteine S-methyltransferase